MTTSVIIPTYNGAHKILNAVKSIAAMDVLPEELLIVIDGSTDDTKQLLQNADFTPLNVKVIYQQNGGRAVVRNNGAKNASGDLLFFLDDDMIVTRGWLKAHIQHHLQHKNIFVTGRLEDYNEDLKEDFVQFKCWLNRKWSNGNPMPEDLNKMNNVYLTAGNMSVRKDVFLATGGFDENLTDAEDFDLGTRAQKSGYGLYFSNTAIAYHNDLANATCSEYIKRLRQYSKAQEKLAALKPELYKSNNQYQQPVPKGMKGFVFKNLASKKWIERVDKKKLIWLPQNIRYKLYDMIVTANGSYFTDAVKF